MQILKAAYRVSAILLALGAPIPSYAQSTPWNWDNSHHRYHGHSHQKVRTLKTNTAKTTSHQETDPAAATEINGVNYDTVCPYQRYGGWSECPVKVKKKAAPAISSEITVVAGTEQEIPFTTWDKDGAIALSRDINVIELVSTSEDAANPERKKVTVRAIRPGYDEIIYLSGGKEPLFKIAVNVVSPETEEKIVRIHRFITKNTKTTIKESGTTNMNGGIGRAAVGYSRNDNTATSVSETREGKIETSVYGCINGGLSSGCKKKNEERDGNNP